MRLVPIPFQRVALAGLLLAGPFVASALSCAGVKASSVPLGGTHRQEAAAKPSGSAAGGASATLIAPPIADKEEAGAEEVVIAPLASASSQPAEAGKPAAPGAFQFRPYSVGQTWTRVFDAEFEMKVGPAENFAMRMVNHQETRFEVLALNGGNLDKLAVEYTVDTSKMVVMGQDQKQPSVLAGKRYVVTFPQGKPDVRNASGGGTPTKKELDSVNDDAREPLEIVIALKELVTLTSRGKGDFSPVGAVALAGGQDDDTKVTGAKASLRQVNNNTHGQKSALVDLGYTVINSAEDDVAIEARVTGNLLVLDAPARYQSFNLQGPLELRPTKAGGMQGRGTVKLSMTYKY